MTYVLQPLDDRAGGLRRPSPSTSTFRTASAAASALLIMLAAVLAPAPPAHAADGLFLKTFAAENENGTHSRTREQAIADAKNFDVISALPQTYRDHIGAMRTANPNLVVLAYMNGTFAQESQGTTYPSSWYARDKSGAKVRSQGYGNYLMRPNEPGWVSDRIAACRALLQRSGYTGCMVDMLGVAPVVPGYTTSLPFNPATGSNWTMPDWQRITASLASKMQAGVDNGIVWGNGYGSGPRYFESVEGPSRLLKPTMAGGTAEVWLRTAKMSLSSFRSESDWKRSVDMLVDVGASGDRAAVMVKLWATGTLAQKDANHRYALASFLLGSNGGSSLNISYSHDDNVLTPHPYWDRVDIGSPSSAYVLSGGVYQRPFTRGRVLVNPTSVSRTIQLDTRHVNLQGTAITSITLPPNTGDVLRKVS